MDFFLVGGIHTVIRSKASVTTGELGDQYCMIGPFHDPTVRLEVEVMEPEFSLTREVVEAMRKEGVKVSLNNFVDRWKNEWTVKTIVLIFSLGYLWSVAY